VHAAADNELITGNAIFLDASGSDPSAGHSNDPLVSSWLSGVQPHGDDRHGDFNASVLQHSALPGRGETFAVFDVVMFSDQRIVVAGFNSLDGLRHWGNATGEVSLQGRTHARQRLQWHRILRDTTPADVEMPLRSVR